MAVALSAGAPGTGARQVVRVEKKTFRLVQRELGVIEAGKTAMLYTQSSGEIVWIAPEGSKVKAGDPVVKLSNRVTEEEAEQDGMRLEDRKLQLRREELEHELGMEEAQFGLKRRAIEVRQAEWELRDLKQRSTQRQLKMMDLDARIAKIRMDHAKVELDAVRAFQGTTLAKTEELREKMATYERAVVAYQRARALLDAARKGPNRRRVEVAEKRLKRARQAYELEKLQIAQKERVAQAEIEIEKANLGRAETRAARSAKKAAQLTIYAPMDGTVTFVDVWKGEGEDPSPIRVGESRHTNMDLLKIADLSELLVRLHVSEADLRKIKMGQKASIKLVAFPDKVYAGEVTQIAPFAEDKNIKLGYLAMSRGGIAGVAVVDVMVRVLDADPRLRLGLTAQVDITVAEKAGALVVPHTAVWFEEGRAFCYVDSGAGPLARPIKLGLANENEIVVEDGLKEGDPVCCRAAAPTEPH